MWKLNSGLLTKESKKKSHEKLKKYSGMSENENTTYYNVWDTVKIVLSGKFVAVNTLIKKRRSQVNNLTL